MTPLVARRKLLTVTTTLSLDQPRWDHGVAETRTVQPERSITKLFFDCRMRKVQPEVKKSKEKFPAPHKLTRESQTQKRGECELTCAERSGPSDRSITSQ